MAPNLISINPATGEKLGEVKISTDEEIKNKVAEAQSVKLQWKEIGVRKRAEILRKLYNLFEKRKEELAHLVTKEMGMPISQSRSMDVQSGLDYFKWYLENSEKYLSPEITSEDNKSIHTVYYEPIGVAAVIAPWNFPFSNFVWTAIPNMLVGNPVVFKHSEECPLFGKLVDEIVKEANLPNGIFSEIYGDGKVGAKLVEQNIDLICFTGSAVVGKQLYQAAAKKFIKIVLELGGSAPGLVLKDADIDNVLETIYFSRFVNCGQACDALKRLIVDESIVDKLVEKLKKYLESKNVGDPENEETEIGSLVAKRQLDLLKTQVENAVEKGAKIIIGGSSIEGSKGNYYKPTILTNVKPNMRVWKEEVFGPVLPIVTFKTEDEAVKLANDTKYGLGAYVFTRDKNKAKDLASKIDSGMVQINNTSYILPCSPFGGYKESGIGREHGKYGLRELSQIKVVSNEK